MAATAQDLGGVVSVARNRKAGFDVAIQDTWEAGLMLTGDEIKSIRAGRVQLIGGYVRILNEGPVVLGIHLSLAKNPDRVRKLLLSKKEIEKLDSALRVKGKIAVPLDIHYKHGWAKLTIGIGVGRKAHDKRELLKKRDLDRQLSRQ